MNEQKSFQFDLNQIKLKKIKTKLLNIWNVSSFSQNILNFEKQITF